MSNGLPFVDTAYDDPNCKALIDGLVAAELEEMAPGDALHPQTPELRIPFAGRATLVEELERATRREKRAPGTGLDESRFRVPRPKDPADAEAWKRAVRNAKTQLEYQRGRMVNLELLDEYGAAAWEAAADASEQSTSSFLSASAALEADMSFLEKQRRADQARTGMLLGNIERRYSELLGRLYHVTWAVTCMRGSSPTEDSRKRAGAESESGSESKRAKS